MKKILLLLMLPVMAFGQRMNIQDTINKLYDERDMLKGNYNQLSQANQVLFDSLASTKLQLKIANDTIAAMRYRYNWIPNGINVHLFSVKSNSNVDRTLALVRELGKNAIRVDIQTNNDGTMKTQDVAKMNELLSKLNEITLVPCINLDADDIETGYQRCYDIGKGFASTYPLPYYEGGNELSFKMLSDGKKALLTGDGDKAINYDLKKVELIVQAYKGFTDGVKSVRPKSKVIVNDGFKHTYVIAKAIESGAKIDIVAWHIYTNNYFEGIYSYLKTIFPNQTIWVNESGIVTDKNGNYTQAQFDKFNAIYKEFKPYGNFTYELIDNELRVGSAEAYFGAYDKAFNKKAVWNVVRQ